MMRGPGLLCALAVGLFALAAGQARAETAAERFTCTPSVLMLCPREALAGNRAAATQCLVANLARASPQCQVVVRRELMISAPSPRSRVGRAPG
jgi:hypothetical protein